MGSSTPGRSTYIVMSDEDADASVSAMMEESGKEEEKREREKERGMTRETGVMVEVAIASE